MNKSNDPSKQMLKLMYITNKSDVAILASQSGVDRIFIDLELLGKEKRQGHLNTVISNHRVEDITAVRKVLNKSKLLVRVDPMNPKSREQINTVIGCGADIVMLPMLKSAEEVKSFVEMVDERAKVMLLLETPQAMARVDDITDIPGIDEIHIGLNDLHLGMKLDFMFELLSGGLVDYICGKIAAKKIPYGFGGIARLGKGLLPAEYVIAEHYRLGSSMSILSRSFCDANLLPLKQVEKEFINGVAKIREFEKSLATYASEDFEKNRLIVKEKVKLILDTQKERNA